MTLSEREALRRDFLFSFHCAMPGIVESFDPETQTVTVRPAIKTRRSLSSGSPAATPTVMDSLPLLRDVPVFFPGTRSSAITWMIEPGDECLVIFADSAIDRWFDTGEPSEPPSDRAHDLSDAFAFVGFRSRPNALQNFPSEPSFFGGNP